FILLLFYFFSSSVFFLVCLFFSFTPPAPTDIYTLSLHDALPISPEMRSGDVVAILSNGGFGGIYEKLPQRLKLIAANASAPSSVDRKSTRLNSSHQIISYAVFCLKKKKKKKKNKYKT